MKKMIHLAIFVIAIVHNYMLQAQCWETINTTTTDWRNYPGAGGNNLSNNNWNWTNDYPNFAIAYLTSNKDMVSQKIIPVPLSSPFYSPQTSTGQNLNLEHFQSRPSAQKDYWPEDGWELLVKNFGECPNPPNCYEATAVGNPFFALYNRLTGQVRAFMMIVKGPTDKKMTGAMIEMNFTASGAKRALFAHAQPIGNAVDNFDNVLYQRSPNRYVNEDNYWIFADFLMSYDPCTCFNPTQDSKLIFRYSLLYNSDVTLTGTGVINEKIIQNTEGGVSPSSSGYAGIFGMDIDPVTAAKQGMKAYKTWEGYKNSANKFFDSQNELYQQKMEEEFFNSAQGPIVVDGQTITSMEQLQSLDKGTKKLMGLGGDDPQLAVMKGVASTLPYVGTAIAIIDMFVAGGTKKEETKATRAPMSFEIKQDFQGTINSENPVGDRFFYTPGSKTSAPNWLPIYNNTLGVFNLLEQPKMEYFYYRPIDYNGLPVVPDLLGYVPRLRQYKLKQNLQYVINPAANLEVVAIDVAYVIEYDKRFANHYYSEEMLSNCFLEFGDSSRYLPINERLNKSGLELEYLSKNYPNTGFMRIRTPYVPISCFNEQSFILYYREISGPAAPDYRPEFFIKFYIKLRRTDVTGAEDVTMITTHKIADPVAYATNSGTPTQDFQMGRTYLGPYTFIMWPKRFINGAPTYDNKGFLPLDITLINTNVTQNVMAKRNITIGPGNTFSPNVTIHAGKHIFFQQGVALNVSEVNFKTGGLTIAERCTAPAANSKATNQAITNVCTSPAYLLHVNGPGGFRVSAAAEEEKGQEYSEDLQTSFVKIRPNPTNDLAWVSFSLSEKQPVTISLIDLFGNTVLEIAKNTLFDSGMNELPVKTNELASGTYVLKFSSEEYSKNEKIVIVK